MAETQRQALLHYLAPWFCTLACALCSSVLAGPQLSCSPHLCCWFAVFLLGLVLETSGDVPSTQLILLILQVLLDWSRKGRDLGTVRGCCWLSPGSIYPPSSPPLHSIHQYMYLYSS